MKQYTYIPLVIRIISLVILLSINSSISYAQAGITGPTCATIGVPTSYVLYAYSGNCSYYVSNATLSTGGTGGSHSAAGNFTITVTWSGNGSVNIYSSGGNASLSVSTNTPFSAGSISSGQTQTINYGTTPVAINCAASTGGTCSTPNIVYQWQQSPDNINFSNISGATSQNLGFSSGATQTAYYRRFATETTGNHSGFSNVASVVLNPPNPILPVNGGSVSAASQNINFNTVPATLSSTGVSGGTYTYSFQWQSSPDNSNWTNIPVYTTTCSPGSLTATTYYRVGVTSNGVTGYSSSAVVNVYPQLIAGNIASTAINIVSGGNPGGISCGRPTGGNGIYVYQWQSSTDGVNFPTSIAGANSLSYLPGNLSSNIWYRLMVTSNGVSAYSNIARVSVVSSSPDLSFTRGRDILKAGVLDSTAAGALTSVNDVVQTTQYFDGLGRQVQTVAMQQSPQMKDLVTFMQYDDFGREAYKYLPYVASTNDGNYKNTAVADQYNFNAVQFPGEQYYYGQVNFEPSPLNRVLSSMAPGMSWTGSARGAVTQYQVNSIADSVRLWTIAGATGSIPTSTVVFPAGTLYKNATVDEAGHTVVEYKDIEGKLLLKKTQLAASPGTAHAGWLCTYYVYDIMGNLRFVLQPQAVQLINSNWSISSGIASELCFRYEYDQRRRMIIKKVPGAGEQWMVYDAKNRVVMTQDSVLRSQQKWLVSRYDTQNRQDSTGLFTDALYYNNLSYHLNLASNTINYPNTTSNFELLSQKFYDDYSWASGTPAFGLSASSQSKLISNYNVSPDYAVAPTPYLITRGMQTGAMEKVLGTTATYLYSLNFYDDRGRVIQTQRGNYSGSMDTLTTQYGFSGKPLRILLNHQKGGNTLQHHDVLTKMGYDGGQRLKTVWKNIDGAASDQLIDSMQYNELGQLRAKYLGSALDNQVYEYNIRGWLTGINKKYIQGTQRSYFGMELGYDNSTAAVAGASYSPLFDGNIAGTIWKGGGDGINRKYDFSYDNVSRLVAAGFTQNSSGSSWDSATVNYSMNNLKYDANGNILGMNQSGLKINSSGLIDQLTYTYAASSNKLMQVADAANDSLSVLGDFHYKGTKQSTDYGYDGNGSMTHDNNKGIDTIVYNYLSLPQLVHMKGKGNILYTYDAAGNRLTKVVMDSLSKKATTTLYINGLVYQQKDTIVNPTGGVDTLQFVSHEEGRARWAFHRWTNGTTGYKWEYDFFEKDHLGNTREVLTQQRDTAQYLATMEAAYRATENALFYNIGSTSVWSYNVNAASGPNPFGTTVTNPNDSVCRLSGSTPKEGPAIILKVMAGDLYKVGVNTFWKSGQTSSGTTDALSDILSSLANGIVSVAGPGKGSYSSLSNTTSSPLLGGVNSFRSSKNPNPPSNPKAYLNYIALDNQFNYDSSSSGAQAVGGADNMVTLATDTIRIKKNGYLYIYLTNETNGVSVFFDNLSVTHYSGPLLEESHYYPFGLTMAGISDKALKTGYAENKYRYNKGSELQNKEFSDGSGLEMYETSLRELDPQLGRWWQIDSKPTEAESPYAAMGNNPILHNDPLGDSIPWPARINAASNIASSYSAWLGPTAIQGAAARRDYVAAAAQIDNADPNSKTQRTDLKEQARKVTPEPYLSAIETPRPMSGERAKINDPTINNASKTNTEFNEAAATAGVIGKGLTAVALVNSTINIATASDPARQAQREGFSWAGAFAGGTIGANYGKAFGPYGALGVGIIGSAIGGFTGGKLSDNLGKGPSINSDLRNVIKKAGASDNDIEYMLTHD